MELGVDVAIAGEDSTQARAAALIEEAFARRNGPLVLVVELSEPGDTAALQAIAGAVTADPNVLTITQPAVSEDARPRPSQSSRRPPEATRRRPTSSTPARDHPAAARAGYRVHGARRGATAILIDLADRVAGRL